MLTERSPAHLHCGAFCGITTENGLQIRTVEAFRQNHTVDEHVRSPLAKAGELGIAIRRPGHGFTRDVMSLQSLGEFEALGQLAKEDDCFAPAVWFAKIKLGHRVHVERWDRVVVILGEIPVLNELMNSRILDDFVKTKFDAVCSKRSGGESENPSRANSVVQERHRRGSIVLSFVDDQ